MSRAERAWWIEGRVQGVGFRWSTVRAARRLGLHGRVWNRPDGAVEVHAGGETEALEALEEWLRAGPPAARVDRVCPVEPGSWARQEGFEVRR